MCALRSLALLVAILPPASGERWATPALGVLFDTGDKALRRVIGVPGAASLGDAIALPVKIDRAFVAPNGSSAIVTGPEGTAILSWTGDDIRFVGLEGALRPASVAWAGRRFALYDGGTGVQIWEGTRLVDSRNVDPLPALGLCEDGTIVPGVCSPGGHYEITDSALVRWQDGSRQVIAAGPFTALAGQRGTIAAAGGELLVLKDGAQNSHPLPSKAVSLEPMRLADVFAMTLEDGSQWIFAQGELHLLSGGRQ
jgi:hypothetical protein